MGSDIDPVPRCDHTLGCITCGDEAVSMLVLEVDDQSELAVCADDSNRRETVEIALVAPVSPGDRLLVHAATALVNEGATA